MKYETELQKGILIKRYKRFLADVQLEDGREITIHCPNTGSMKNCNEVGSTVWFSDSGNPKRKYQHTWEMVSVENGAIAGINTSRANGLIREAIEQGVIPALSGAVRCCAEVKYGSENSRIDLLLEYPDQRCYVEVKNVTLAEQQVAYFPDAVTKRGQKHLRELMQVVRQGDRAVLCFCVQHTGVKVVKPADHIDADYGQIIREAHAQGVEIMAWQCDLNSTEAVVKRALPVDLT